MRPLCRVLAVERGDLLPPPRHGSPYCNKSRKNLDPGPMGTWVETLFPEIDSVAPELCQEMGALRLGVSRSPKLVPVQESETLAPLTCADRMGLLTATTN